MKGQQSTINKQKQTNHQTCILIPKIEIINKKWQIRNSLEFGHAVDNSNKDDEYKTLCNTF